MEKNDRMIKTENEECSDLHGRLLCWSGERFPDDGDEGWRG